MANDPLTFTVDSLPNGIQVYRITGPIVLNNLFELQASLRANASPLLILDLAKVPHIDSAGIGLIVNCQVSAARTERRFALVALPARIRLMLDATKVSSVIPIFATEQQALEG
ncbi:MAG: STAS domain-containing protein [Acidobacteriales bacterium]|nr:STAS domain-containing protein [Terriglobales bacterium]